MEYKSLFRKFKDQNPREVFAYFPYDGQAGETWEAPFKRLAQLAKKEDWAFKRLKYHSKDPKSSFPILTNYLNYTFFKIARRGQNRIFRRKGQSML